MWRVTNFEKKGLRGNCPLLTITDNLGRGGQSPKVFLIRLDIGHRFLKLTFMMRLLLYDMIEDSLVYTQIWCSWYTFSEHNLQLNLGFRSWHFAYTGEGFTLNSDFRNILCSQEMNLVLILFSQKLCVHERNLYFNIFLSLSLGLVFVIWPCFYALYGKSIIICLIQIRPSPLHPLRSMQWWLTGEKHVMSFSVRKFAESRVVNAGSHYKCHGK